MSDINFNDSTLYNSPVDLTLNGTNPDVWAVAGESVDRIVGATAYTSSNDGNVIVGTRLGRPIWTITGDNSSIDVETAIDHTTKDWSVAIAVGDATFHPEAYSNTLYLFLQGFSEASSHSSHEVRFNGTFFTVNEHTPAGGAANINVPKGMVFPKDSVLTFVHTSTSSGQFTMYVNGVAMGTVAHTEVYNSSTPTYMRVGNLATIVQYNSAGYQVYAFAVWESALSAADVRKLTLDNMTAPLL